MSMIPVLDEEFYQQADESDYKDIIPQLSDDEIEALLDQKCR